MTASEIDVLTEAVTHYDRRGEPVTVEDLATKMDVEGEDIRTCFDDFESKHLLKRVEGGCRPTVTARELLELDVSEEALLIIDTEPEE